MRDDLTAFVAGLKKHLIAKQSNYIREVAFTNGKFGYDDECVTQELDTELLEDEIDHYVREYKSARMSQNR